jgi:hypothetical protein
MIRSRRVGGEHSFKRYQQIPRAFACRPLCFLQRGFQLMLHECLPALRIVRKAGMYGTQPSRRFHGPSLNLLRFWHRLHGLTIEKRSISQTGPPVKRILAILFKNPFRVRIPSCERRAFHQYSGVQEEWRLVDLELAEMPGLCLVVKPRASDGLWAPWMNGQQRGARVYSAAWRDRSGRIHDWYELWVQDAGASLWGGDDPMARVDNSTLATQWSAMVKGIEQHSPMSIIRLGWEEVPPKPIWLDAVSAKIITPERSWRLCCDDALLANERLAPYSSTLHRYLVSGEGEFTHFVPITAAAPEGRRTLSVAEAFGNAVPVNEACGMMMLRRADNMLLDDFSDLLSGVENGALPHEKRVLPSLSRHVLTNCKSNMDDTHTGFFFASNRRPGHLGEVLHLKLALLHGAMQALQSLAEKTSAPCLGIRADSFGVVIRDVPSALPYFWNHKVSLRIPSQTLRTEVGDLCEPCFIPIKQNGPSIYESHRIHNQIHGIGRVRIRNVSRPDDDGLVVVEGALITDERLETGKLDLLALEWHGRSRDRLRLFAKMDGNANSIRGEYRFASLQTRLPEEWVEQFSSGDSSLGTDRVSFQLLPRLGTPCDLYSLGVLSLRLLITGPDASLGETVDDLLRMARLFRQRFSNGNWSTGTGSLNEFVNSGEGGAWAEKLGPQHLVGGRISMEEAFSEIPARLWWQVMEFVSRLFPGEALGSFCESFDDFSPRAPAAAFLEPLACVDRLLVCTREMLFGNPRANKEILEMIRGFAACR